MSNNKIKITFWGASPIIFIITILLAIPIIIINYFYKTIFEINFISYNKIVILAIILLSIGVPCYIYTVKIIKNAFIEEKLITNNIFSICRNPLFAIVIFFILPGILLFFKSWLLLAIPFVLYLIFKIFISREEKLLEDKFGQDFTNYKKSTPTIFPMVWKFKR
ncbi:MAG: isoprenylcysteine carboxylmethyltransferase family protein [Spirochaetes bacterium]|nr:isoprenylcysteine carboxylmethyltransferase family protein [Spirochaetota bacterium]